MTSTPPQNTAPEFSPPAYSGSSIPAAPAHQQTNVLAIVALVTSFFVGLAGVVCGHIALSQIKRTNEGGRVLALAGLIIGYCSIAITTVFVVVWIAIVAVAAGSGALR